MALMRSVLHLTAFAVTSLLAIGVARADSIDGNWCSPEGHRLSIAGINITTPGGTKMTGDYTRHSFAYVAPSGDPDAGAAVNLRLLDEDTVRATSSDASRASALWRRCKLETS